jgi:hypothetical protein
MKTRLRPFQVAEGISVDKRLALLLCLSFVTAKHVKSYRHRHLFLVFSKRR